MAERRCFSKKIITSDAFLDMSASARCLYFTLCMYADDDGFVNSPKSIMRQVGACNDDIKILINKKFVIAFDDGVLVIKHWRIHNYIQNDRYIPTNYKEHLETLYLDENKAYTQDNTGKCIQDVYKVYPQDNLSKDKLSKDNIYKENTIVKENSTATAVDSEKKRQYFTPPTVEEVKEYCKERRNGIDAEEFCDFYQSKGWYVGANKMKDWKSAVRTWEKKRKADKTFAERDYTESEMNSVFTDLNNYDDIEI